MTPASMLPDDIRLLVAVLRTATSHLGAAGPPARRARGETGAMTTETVIIVAGLAALALAVVAIIVTKVTDKAESIPT